MGCMPSDPTPTNTSLLKLLGGSIVVLLLISGVSGARTESTSRIAQMSQVISALAPQDIALGDQVQATYRVVVRDFPDGRKFGTQRLGKMGTVTAGPEEIAGIMWWYIDWEQSIVDGWTEEGYLQNTYNPVLAISATPLQPLYGEKVRLEWDARHVSSCTLRGPGVDTTGASGVAETPGLTADAAYTLICTTKWGGEAVQSISIKVGLRQ